MYLTNSSNPVQLDYFPREMINYYISLIIIIDFISRKPDLMHIFDSFFNLERYPFPINIPMRI